MSTYEVMRSFVASFGLAYFGLIFVIALVYVLLPSKRDAFEEAARIPLQED
jgi:cytochrome c oxidase cbb3-type subunit IV